MERVVFRKTRKHYIVMEEKDKKIVSEQQASSYHEARTHQTDFLVVTFNATFVKFWSFRKYNFTLQYRHIQCNRLTNIRK